MDVRVRTLLSKSQANACPPVSLYMSSMSRLLHALASSRKARQTSSTSSSLRKPSSKSVCTPADTRIYVSGVQAQEWKPSWPSPSTRGRCFANGSTPNRQANQRASQSHREQHIKPPSRHKLRESCGTAPSSSTTHMSGPEAFRGFAGQASCHSHMWSHQPRLQTVPGHAV